jgi:hypothetical protein
LSGSKLICSKETCHENVDCGKFATCVNNENDQGGGYKCVCDMGFTGQTVMNGATTCSMNVCGEEDHFCGENTACHDSTRNPICDVNLDSVENPTHHRTASRGTASNSVLHNSAGAWTLSDPKVGDWLEIDLGRNVEILGVVIQGWGQDSRIGRFEVSLYQSEARDDEVVIKNLQYTNVEDEYEIVQFKYVVFCIQARSAILSIISLTRITHFISQEYHSLASLIRTARISLKTYLLLLTQIIAALEYYPILIKLENQRF